MKYPYAVIWNGKFYPAGAEVPEEEKIEEHVNAPKPETQKAEKPQTEKKRAGRPAKAR